MIIELIHEALIAHHFINVLETPSARFYCRESSSAVRFVILHELEELIDPSRLNAAMNQLVPQVFSSNPSFRKNCDLICVHHLKHLADFKNHEEKIFAIEEDPHFFKKYVLYYSDAEDGTLRDQSYKDIQATIADKALFDQYKDQPLTATQYSVAAKIFIKLPFLELPFVKRELVPLRMQAQGAVSEVGLTATYESIQKLNKNNLESLIKGMIDDELENIKD
ncbi:MULTISPECIES: ABC-three component system middle component 1 [Burkholderia]|uniref:ABC-three component system middle component 1 n=1 Tax=Burkholderia TaxID=32008 RepID=UPI00064EF037|nr:MULTISPECIES: ABC-three component system middle component 1 [Burkholderia]KML21665.1 hypothetical protein VL00_03260 [Burkholderia cepacia]KMN60733.1 hypothetical protein VK92_10840 [Burkholderia sp. LK4]